MPTHKLPFSGEGIVTTETKQEASVVERMRTIRISEHYDTLGSYVPEYYRIDGLHKFNGGEVVTATDHDRVVWEKDATIAELRAEVAKAKELNQRLANDYEQECIDHRATEAKCEQLEKKRDCAFALAQRLADQEAKCVEARYLNKIAGPKDDRKVVASTCCEPVPSQPGNVNVGVTVHCGKCGTWTDDVTAGCVAANRQESLDSSPSREWISKMADGEDRCASVSARNPDAIEQKQDASGVEEEPIDRWKHFPYSMKSTPDGDFVTKADHDAAIAELRAEVERVKQWELDAWRTVGNLEDAAEGRPIEIEDGKSPHPTVNVIAELREKLADEERRGDLHADLNKRVAEAIGNPFTGPGSSWHDLPEKVAALRTKAAAVANREAEIVAWIREAASPFAVMSDCSSAVAYGRLQAIIEKIQTGGGA